MTEKNNEDNIGLKDPEQAELELKMSKEINAMPAEVKDRFKALKTIYDQCLDLDEEEEKEYRILELKYEKLYSDVYKKRAEVLNGELASMDDLAQAFDDRAE